MEWQNVGSVFFEKFSKNNMYHGKILFLRGRKIRRSDATPIKICKLNNHQNLNESSGNNWSLIFV